MIDYLPEPPTGSQPAMNCLLGRRSITNTGTVIANCNANIYPELGTDGKANRGYKFDIGKMIAPSILSPNLGARSNNVTAINDLGYAIGDAPLHGDKPCFPTYCPKIWPDGSWDGANALAYWGPDGVAHQLLDPAYGFMTADSIDNKNNIFLFGSWRNTNGPRADILNINDGLVVNLSQLPVTTKLNANKYIQYSLGIHSDNGSTLLYGNVEDAQYNASPFLAQLIEECQFNGSKMKAEKFAEAMSQCQGTNYHVNGCAGIDFDRDGQITAQDGVLLASRCS